MRLKTTFNNFLLEDEEIEIQKHVVIHLRSPSHENANYKTHILNHTVLYGVIDYML